jgi:uncharacterized protein YqeY
VTHPSIRERLDADMKQALRSGDRLRLETLRMARSAVRNAEIETRSTLEGDAIVAVLRGLVKQRRESIELFRKGGREDLATREEQEVAVLEEYMPALLDEAAVEAIVREVIASEGASDARDLGKVMKATIARLQGRADGKQVNAIARRLLGGS